MNINKLCLNATEVSDSTGLSLSMVRKLTRNGKIPHIKVGCRILYPVSEIKKWLTNNTISISCSSKDGVING